MKDITVRLFISRESATYHFIRKQVESACGKARKVVGRVRLKVVEIEDKPEMVERYNVEALPLVIVGEKRFVGVPAPDELAGYIGLAEPASGTAR